MRKSYVLLAVLAVFLVVVASAGTAGAKKPVKAEVTTYNVNLNVGEEAVLATAGALTLSARCVSAGGGALEMFFTSTVDNWWSGEGHIHAAGEEIWVLRLGAPTYELKDSARTVQDDAWAPDGSALFLTVPVQIRWNLNGFDCGVGGIVGTAPGSP